jgi:hypothetical protein
MGTWQIGMIILALGGLLGAVALEMRRQRREGRQLREMHRRLMVGLN